MGVICTNPSVKRMGVPRNRPYDQKAFTLVEVTIAVGIIAAVAIPAFALLAIGTDLNRESQRNVFVSQIIDQIGREIAQTPYSELPDSYPLFLFDVGGVRLTDPGDPERFYVARVTIDKEARLPGEAAAPGSLARIIIDVVPDRSGSASPSDDLFSLDSEGGFKSKEASRHFIYLSRND